MISPDSERTQYQAACFDFDGTLADTWRLYIEAYRRTLSAADGGELDAAGVVALRPRAEIRFFLDAPYAARFDELYSQFLVHYAAAHSEFCDGWYEGARELFEALERRGIARGLVTGKSRRAYEITAANIGALDLVVSIFDDDVNRPKPDAEGLLRAAHGMNVDPAEMIYVGDSEVDLRAAMNSGAGFAAAMWAKNEEEQQQFRVLCSEYTRSHLLDEPAELLFLLPGTS